MNFFIESLPMIRSTGVALRMCSLISKVSYLLLLSSKNVTRNRNIVFDFKQRLCTLCKEFKDIFSNELPAAPAKIPEFHLTVKDNEIESCSK